MNRKVLLFSIVAVLILSACKTTRKIQKTEVVPAKSSLTQLIENVQRNQTQFKTANVSKMAMEFTLDDRNVSVSASCKVQKDSAIFLSIQPFMGIELFKAELLPDSMRIFDKMNHRYYVTDYSYFMKRFGIEVDFYSLQALIFDQLFCIGKKEVLPESCKLIPLDGGRNKIEYETDNMLQSTEISATNSIQQVLLKAKKSNYQLKTNYADFSVANGVNFPQKISMLASNQKSKASCDFSILRVEFNVDLKFSATSKERYTRGDIEQIIKK